MEVDNTTQNLQYPTKPSVASPSVAPLENPLEVQEQPKKKYKKPLLIIMALILLLLVTGVGVFLFLRLEAKKEKGEGVDLETSKEKETLTTFSKTSKYEIRESDVLVNLGVGFKIAVDKDWEVSIVESGKEHNFLTAQAKQGIKIEIEAFSHSLANWQDYLKNSLIQVEKTELKKIGKNDVEVQTGKESFAESKRKVIVGRWEGKDKTLLVRVYSSEKQLMDAIFNQLANSVSYDKGESALILKLVKKAYAADVETPSKLPQIDYKVVGVMEEPFTDEIVKDDSVYKDGFVKGYRFIAFKSQRLAAYAVEDRESNPNSFIRSQVFDSKGEAISNEMNTHIEFKAPYTGEYFLLVYSFNQQEGRFTLRIDDHDQMGCKTLIKYPDGAELLINPEESNSSLVGVFDVGYIRQCSTPITLLGDDTIQYQFIPREPGKEPSLMTYRISVTMSPDLKKPKEGVEADFTPVGDNPENTTQLEIELLQLSANRILITSKEGLFPKNRQFFVQGWGGRFFTQEVFKAPELPILKNIVNDYPEEFSQIPGKYSPEAIEGIYIDWKKEDETVVELLSGRLKYRKEIKGEDYLQQRQELLERFKQYFIDKGYFLSEKNTFTIDSETLSGPVSVPEGFAGNPWRTKEVVGLSKSSTVCKIINDTGKTSLYIYCAVLP